MNYRWPLTPLGEILTERQEVPSSEDIELGRIRIVEKIGFDSGRIQLRSDGSTKTGMILVRPGDLLLSGINAAKGAIAIYDESAHEPIAATIHYGAYIPKRDRVSVQFLWRMLRSRFFQDLLLEFVPGGIKTELKAKRFLPVPVPLPPLAEQRRIVAGIEEQAAKINEARTLRQQAAEEAEKIVKAALRSLVHEIKPIGKLLDVLSAAPRNGWSPRCDNAEEGVPVLSLGAITGFHYRSSEFKRTSLYVPRETHIWLQPGDLLITRSNTLELVGHAAIYDGNPSPCIYPDLIMRLELKNDCVDSRFVWYWLQSSSVREFISKHAKGTSPTMKKISQGIVMSIPFPSMLTLSEQRRIVAELDALQSEAGNLKRLQAETAVELDALFPSILDRAFKGEL